MTNAEFYAHVVGHCNIYTHTHTHHAFFQADMGNWFYKKQPIENATNIPSMSKVLYVKMTVAHNDINEIFRDILKVYANLSNKQLCL